MSDPVKVEPVRPDAVDEVLAELVITVDSIDAGGRIVVLQLRTGRGNVRAYALAKGETLTVPIRRRTPLGS